MFLIERVFGITLYVSLLLIVSYLFTRVQKTHYRFLIIAYLLLISTMAFFYMPAFESDLYRLTEYMYNYASMSWEEFISIISSSNVPVTLLYYRLIGSFGVAGLLAGVTALIVFWNIFYIILDYSKNFKEQGKLIAASLLVIMSTGIYMQTVGGIRTMLAFSIVTRCFYDETIHGKRIYKNIFWYVLACLIHPTAAVAIILRFVALILSNMRARKNRALLAGLIISPLIAYAILAVGGFGIFENAFNTAIIYRESVDYSYIWDTIIGVTTIALILISYYLYRRYNKAEKSISLSSVAIYSQILLIFSIASFYEHATFVRFTQLNLLVMIPVIMNNFSSLLASSRGDDKKERLVWLRVIICMVLLIFIISMTRGALSSLKFFVI